MAFVFLVINFFMDLIEIQKESGSMSANTGIAFQCNMAAEQAVIVQVGKIISSPGSIPKAPTAQVRPVDQELTKIACFTLKNFSTFLSNFSTK